MKTLRIHPLYLSLLSGLQNCKKTEPTSSNSTTPSGNSPTEPIQILAWLSGYANRIGNAYYEE